MILKLSPVTFQTCHFASCLLPGRPLPGTTLDLPCLSSDCARPLRALAPRSVRSPPAPCARPPLRALALSVRSPPPPCARPCACRPGGGNAFLFLLVPGHCSIFVGFPRLCPHLHKCFLNYSLLSLNELSVSCWGRD